MSNNKCSIIGASHAGVSLAMQLRREGWPHEIELISDEMELPYHRPPLSKDLLLGKKTLDQIRLRPEKMFEDNDISLSLGRRVKAIHKQKKKLIFTDGKESNYGKLAICVGSTVKKIPFGNQFENVFYLREATDVKKIQSVLPRMKRVVIIGAGYIGLEVGAVLRQLGIEVTIVDIAKRVLERVTSSYLSQWVRKLHEDNGVSFILGTGVKEIKGEGQAESVVCTNGKALDCDAVFVGIGVNPNVELAREIGLKVDRGIIVNETCKTSEDDIYAAGDCTQFYTYLYDKVINLESVQNANDQARCAAVNIAGGSQIYESLPWFWSDQYDAKIQMVGLNHESAEIIVRGNPNVSDKNGLALFYLKNSRVVAADCVNRPKEFAAAKQLIQSKMYLAKSILEDESIDPLTFKDLTTHS